MSKNGFVAHLEFNDRGFVVVTGRGARQQVEWDLVREIAAYRRDPAGADVMTLGIRPSAAVEYIEIDEDNPDYKQLLESMYEAIPAINRDWWCEISSSYGPNRTTIYGLSTAEQQGPSPAERYLQNPGHKNPSRKKIKRETIVWITVAVVVLAIIQWLIAMLLCRWSNALGLAFFPLLLIAFVARTYPNPRVFLYLLIGFNLAGWGLRVVFGLATPSLLGQLFAGHLTYLLLLGIEVLLGLGIMLLPDRRAAGPEIKGLNRKA
ncbi:MAG: hypothetical protein KAR11_04495 [Phycisphaerae bacterium]|nr:hypothetical protein [Phycisphaerae bacterium]